jgi:sensor histidine kinase regulating citrate/malate metabolism
VAAAHRDAILESIGDGVFAVDRNWHITAFKLAAGKVTGVRRKGAINRRRSEVFRTSKCAEDCAFKHTTKTGPPAGVRLTDWCSLERTVHLR